MEKSDKIEKACKEFGINKEQLKYMMSPGYWAEAYARSYMVNKFIKEQDNDDDL